MEYEKTGYLHDNFKMFHLTDQEEKTYDFHYHDFMKIMLFISGDVSYCVEGYTYHLQPYDVVLVNAGEIHRPVVHSALPYERIIIYMSSDFISSYKNDSYDLAYCFQKAREEQTHVLRMTTDQKNRLYQAAKELERSFSDTGFASELHNQILFLEFLIQLNRSSIKNDISFLDTDSSNQKIQDILHYINENLDSNLSVDTLASHFYLSKYYLMHSFKKETGYTIGNYITTKRLFLARELIQNGSSIAQACYACGFQHYSTFSRAYKKMFQSMPKELKDNG